MFSLYSPHRFRFDLWFQLVVDGFLVVFADDPCDFDTRHELITEAQLPQVDAAVTEESSQFMSAHLFHVSTDAVLEDNGQFISRDFTEGKLPRIRISEFSSYNGGNGCVIILHLPLLLFYVFIIVVTCTFLQLLT